MMRRALVLLCVLSGSAAADRRLFTSTYEYRTMPEGGTALELWHSESRTERTGGDLKQLEHVLEVEHGITDRWDAGVLLIFAQSAVATNRSDYTFDQTRLQNRYRFADRSEWPVDLQLQLDVAKHFGVREYNVDLRVTAARDIDKLTVAVNALAMLTVVYDVDTRDDYGWAAGASYELHPKLNAGVEGYGIVRGERAAVGPALAVAPASKLWVTVTGAFGLTANTPDIQVRGILGIEL